MIAIKKFIKAAATLIVAVVSLGAQAQQNSNSVSNAETASTSTSTNAGNAQSINFNSEAVRSQTIRTNPGIAMGSFSGSFSSDYCGGTAAAGVSLPGFGATGGAPVIDPQCVQLRTFERTVQLATTVGQVDPVLRSKLIQASVDILCNVSDRTQVALKNQGVCSDLQITTASHRQVNPNQVPVASAQTGAGNQNNPPF